MSIHSSLIILSINSFCNMLKVVGVLLLWIPTTFYYVVCHNIRQHYD